MPALSSLPAVTTHLTALMRMMTDSSEGWGGFSNTQIMPKHLSVNYDSRQSSVTKELMEESDKDYSLLEMAEYDEPIPLAEVLAHGSEEQMVRHSQ